MPPFLPNVADNKLVASGSGICVPALGSGSTGKPLHNSDIIFDFNNILSSFWDSKANGWEYQWAFRFRPIQGTNEGYIRCILSQGE